MRGSFREIREKIVGGRWNTVFEGMALETYSWFNIQHKLTKIERHFLGFLHACMACGFLLVFMMSETFLFLSS